jgi:hypothetical protein
MWKAEHSPSISEHTPIPAYRIVNYEKYSPDFTFTILGTGAANRIVSLLNLLSDSEVEKLIVDYNLEINLKGRI